MLVVIMLKLSQFSLQVTCVPEKYVIKIFAANRSDQLFDEGMFGWATEILPPRSCMSILTGREVRICNPMAIAVIYYF